MDNSYKKYIDACDRYSTTPIKEDLYKNAIIQASIHLTSIKHKSGKYPFIVLQVGELLVKFKYMSDKIMEINFFTDGQYKIITQYKED